MQQTVMMLSSFASVTDAKTVARELLQRGLVGCVSLLPQVLSLYHWQDELAESSEVLVLMKTTADCAEALKEALLSSHPYDTPELLIWKATASEPYQQWLEQVVSGQGNDPKNQ